MSSLISIIVPIYNTEKYLRRCVNSILAQTYKKLEVILIDDGSSDRSGNICDEYAAFDNRVKVLHIQNGGLSNARNQGLNLAKGEYIGFVDSDDYIHERTIEILYHNLVETKSDLSGISYCKFVDVNPKANLKNKQKIFKKNLFLWFLRDNHLYYVCRYLYPRSIVENVRFDRSMKIAEDQQFNFEICKKSKTVVFSSFEGYFYFQNVKSLSHGKVKATFVQDLEFRTNIYQELESRKEKKFAKAHLFKAYLSYYVKAIYFGKSCDQDVVSYCGNFLRKRIFQIIFLPNFGLKRKIACTFLLFGDKFYQKFFIKFFSKYV